MAKPCPVLEAAMDLGLVRTAVLPSRVEVAFAGLVALVLTAMVGCMIGAALASVANALGPVPPPAASTALELGAVLVVGAAGVRTGLRAYWVLADMVRVRAFILSNTPRKPWSARTLEADIAGTVTAPNREGANPS